MADQKLRGFARYTPEQRREMAARGGSSVPSEKRGWAKDRSAASEAGRKGGQVSKKPRTTTA
jgi:general stress protein YciG